MHAPAVYAVCGAALFAAVAAVPMKRDVVWETYTEEVVTTVAVTATVWVDATDAPTPDHVYAPATTSAAPIATTQPAKAPYIPPIPSSSSVYVAPAPAPPTSTSSSPQAQAPSPSPAPAPESSSTSVYVPPPSPPPPATTSSSVYVAPSPAPAPAPATTSVPAPAAPASTTPWSAAAPAPSPSNASPPAGGSSPSGKTYSGDITYYEPGLGSCGEYSTDSEPVVALAAGMMQKSYCGSSITISYQGSKQTAKIVDTCPGCSGASLDLSSTLFKAVAPNGDGRVHDVEWWFN